MKTGDLVRLNLDETTNNWFRRCSFNDESYWTYPVRQLGEIDGKPVYLREQSPTVVHPGIHGIILDVESGPIRNPIVVMMNGSLYAFEKSELTIIIVA